MEDSGIIMEKLKRHPWHRDEAQDVLDRLAIEHTCPKNLSYLFSHLLVAGNRLAMEIAHDDYDELQHPIKMDDHHKKVKQSTAQACYLPVKFSLQKLRHRRPPGMYTFSSWLNIEYGPFHSSLIVGDVTIEWGRDSIVEHRYDPIPEAEFKANVEDQGEWAGQQGQFQRLMSLADRERNSEKKLDILCESMTAKVRLIAKLVDVIVDYNRNKRYSVFHCNCHHFVRDAMAALGIHEPVKFHGKLQRHFEQLKRGNVKIPPELKGHKNLDKYITANMKDLERQDMEYLQCLYFKAHLPALEKARDPDKWKCDIPTCMSGKLDVSIQEHALRFNQLLPDPMANGNQECDSILSFDQIVLSEIAFGELELEKGITNKPLLPSLCENVSCLVAEYDMVDLDNDVNDEVAATAFMNTSMKKQHKLAAKFSGYRDQVKLKFQEHPQYDKDKEEKFVDILTEVEPFYEHFFSSHSENTSQIIQDICNDRKSQEDGTLTLETVHCRTRERFGKLCDFPISLIYHTGLKQRRSSFLKTPLFASLQINNYILEWNERSLVFPKKVECTGNETVTTDHLVLVQNLAHNSKWTQFVAEWTSQLDRALEKDDETAVIAIMYNLSEKRDKLILPLIQLVTNYNRYKHYHCKKCSNYEFVLAAMQLLEVETPPVKCASLKDYLQTQLPDSALADTHFKTHYDLDLYMFENIGGENFGKEKMEILVSKYFMFHIEDRNQKRVKEWTCTEPSCQLLELLKKLTMIIYLQS